MNKFILSQLQELVRRDYRVPVFTPINLMDLPPLDSIQNHSISLKECLLPLIEKLHKLERDRVHLLRVVQYFTSHGCLFHYMSNIEKEDFMDSPVKAFPDVKWTTWYDGNKK